MRASSKVIVGLLILAVVYLVVMKLTAEPGVTDDQQIRDQLSTAAAAVADRNPDGVLAVISQNYTDSDDNNIDRLSLYLHRAISQSDNPMASVQPTDVSVTGDTAKSTCLITVSNAGAQIFQQSVELDWKKETTHQYVIFPDHVWRIVHSSFSGSLPGEE